MNNLSNELFFEAHRGINEPKENVQKPLGIHWSKKYSVADDFATHAIDPSDKTQYRTAIGGTRISARIPISSVETNTNTIDTVRGGTFPDEKEITVKKGAPVHVTELTYETRDMKRFRSRKYNPPRQMMA